MDDSIGNLGIIERLTHWLQVSGLSPWAAEWLTPHHPLLVLSTQALWMAEPLADLLGAQNSLTTLAHTLEDPTRLRAWAAQLSQESNDGRD